jgi:hypothetical protein
MANIKMRVNGEDVHPSRSRIPYLYATRERAEKALNTFYPDQCREQRLGGEVTVDVAEDAREPNMGDLE